MKSFYIGTEGARLYCNLHEPASRLVRGTSVLLCPPLGHEYYRTYRAFARLAEHLADAGYFVMRFDYLGTGESEGPSGHPNLEGWSRDVQTAAHALLERSRTETVALVGMRFGAVAAALAANTMSECKLLLLWEPVTAGNAYLRQLQSLHEYLLNDLERFPFPRDRRDSVISEYVGHVYGTPLVNEIGRFHLERAIASTCSRAKLTASEELSNEQCRIEKLPHAGYGWADGKRVSETVVDPAANRLIHSLLDEVAA